jgi:Fe2+ transport system protein FeoA
VELASAEINNWYTIKELRGSCDELHSKLMSHGLIPGETVMVKRFAPIFKDPILIQIGNTQLALTKTEAMNIILNKLD